MAYATQSQLVERYGEPMIIDLSDRAVPPVGAIDAGVVTQALDDASALIDGYLKGRYALPLVSTPPLLRDQALPIAVYKLHRNVASDKVRADYDDALGVLRQIANGIVRLDIAGVEPAGSGLTGVRTNDRDRDLTPDNMKGYI